MASGFYQLKIRDADMCKTAFVTPKGLYEHTVVPFGLTNSPPSFVRAMTQVLKVPNSVAVVYLDVILILG